MRLSLKLSFVTQFVTTSTYLTRSIASSSSIDKSIFIPTTPSYFQLSTGLCHPQLQNHRFTTVSGRRGTMPTTPHPKTCASCGRKIEWRKKWEKDWDNVRYCSDTCRKRKVRKVDKDLETAILDLLASRANTSTICPSEAAKRVGGPQEENWRPLMEPARMAARRLVAAGTVEITQRRQIVDPSTAKGPIRVRLVD